MVRKLKNKIKISGKQTQYDDEYRNYLKDIDLNELQDKINRFRMLDFKTIDYPEISKEIRKVISVNRGDNEYAILNRKNSKYSTGTKFFRVRKLKKDDHFIPFRDIVTPKDMWIPPKEIVGLGRLNKENEPLLYTSPMSPFIAVEEMKVLNDENFIVAVYESIMDINVCLMGLAEKNPDLNEETNFKQRMINDFMVHEFIRDVGEDTKYLYKISETLMKDYYDLPDEFQDAWCYPSVAMKGSVNVCFREEKAKSKLNLVGIMVGTKHKDKTHFKLVGLSDGFETPFSYYPIGSDEQKRFFPEINTPE